MFYATTPQFLASTIVKQVVRARRNGGMCHRCANAWNLRKRLSVFLIYLVKRLCPISERIQRGHIFLRTIFPFGVTRLYKPLSAYLTHIADKIFLQAASFVVTRSLHTTILISIPPFLRSPIFLRNNTTGYKHRRIAYSLSEQLPGALLQHYNIIFAVPGESALASSKFDELALLVHRAVFFYSPIFPLTFLAGCLTKPIPAFIPGTQYWLRRRKPTSERGVNLSLSLGLPDAYNDIFDRIERRRDAWVVASGHIMFNALDANTAFSSSFGEGEGSREEELDKRYRQLLDNCLLPAW